MADNHLSILSNPAVAERTSQATRELLHRRADFRLTGEPFLGAELYALLQQIVAAILPQNGIGTEVDIAGVIDQRLASRSGIGWRYAELPEDGEAYRRGLTVFAEMLQQTPMKTFAAMPPPAREGYLRCVGNGDVDGPAQFKLSRWLEMLRVDVTTAWISHPSAMQAIGYYGFADGATGNEGWTAIAPNTALPFELGILEESKS